MKTLSVIILAVVLVLFNSSIAQATPPISPGLSPDSQNFSATFLLDVVSRIFEVTFLFVFLAGLVRPIREKIRIGYLSSGFLLFATVGLNFLRLKSSMSWKVELLVVSLVVFSLAVGYFLWSKAVLRSGPKWIFWTQCVVTLILVMLILVQVLVPAIQLEDGLNKVFTLFRSEKELSVNKWKTYTNSEYGFSFEYPGEWNVLKNREAENTDFVQVVTLGYDDAHETMFIAYTPEFKNFFKGYTSGKNNALYDSLSEYAKSYSSYPNGDIVPILKTISVSGADAYVAFYGSNVLLDHNGIYNIFFVPQAVGDRSLWGIGARILSSFKFKDVANSIDPILMKPLDWQVFLENSGSELVGIWQASPGMAAGWSNRYQFFPSGKFSWEFSEMRCNTGTIARYGYWKLVEGKIEFRILRERNRTDSGVGPFCYGSKEETRELTQPVTESVIISECTNSQSDYYSCLDIDGMHYYKFGSDPMYYGHGGLDPEPVF